MGPDDKLATASQMKLDINSDVKQKLSLLNKQ